MPARSIAQRRLPNLPVSAVVALVAIGSYATSAGHDFVYDDVHIIVGNDQLKSLANIGEIVAGSWWPDALYRPATQLSFAIDWAISGGDPRFFHVVNIVLHAVVSVLVLIFGRTLLMPLGATVAALVFAVHPVHVEAVANVVGRAEIMAALFTLTAALLYKLDGDLAARGVSSGRRWHYSFGTLAALALAFGSKESALAAPGVLLIVDWLQARRARTAFTERVRRHWVLLAGSLVLAFEWITLRTLILGGVAGDHPGPGVFMHDFFDRALVMAPVVVEWVRLLIFPAHLSADYSPNYLSGEPAITARGVAGLIILVAGFVVALKAARAKPEVTFCLAWLGGTLLIIANLVVPSGILLSERSLYLPSVGFAFLVGWVAAALVVKHRKVVIGVVALVVAAGVGHTVNRIPVWKNASVFFPQLVRDAPGSFRSMWVAGALAYESGNRVTGERLMRQAIVTYPLFSNTWHDLASYFEEDERWLEAAQFYAAAYRIDSARLYDAVSSISNFVKAGELDSAAALVAAAIEQHGYDYRLLILQGDIALANGDPMRAMTWRRQVTWRFPEAWQYWYLTADAAVTAEYCPEATRSLARARNLNRDFADVLDVAGRLETLRCS